MHPKDIGAASDSAPSQAEDLRDQRVVLTHVLDLHPTRLTVPDLVREITAGAPALDEGDAIERAVRDLTGAGLLNRAGGLVEPTRAAVHFWTLEQDQP